MVQIHFFFTELFLITPSTEIAQMVPLAEKRSLGLQIRNIFKWHLLLKHWSKVKLFHRIVPHDAFYQHCTNSSSPPNKGAARTLDKKFLLMTFPPEQLVQIQNNFTDLELFVIMLFTKLAQMVPLR